MRQVPCYLLIGDGKVAHHFQHYMNMLSITFSTWNRLESLEKLQELLTHTTHILLLISDTAIEQFIEQHLHLTNALCIHFSGSLVCDRAFGAHPLMTFSNNLYTLEKYQSIPFILDHNALEFNALLPGFPNKSVRLNTKQKAKYHALCVLSGNFTCLLWQKLFTTFENEFSLPQSIAHPYLQQQLQNLLLDQKSALSGPLVRKDSHTIATNISALQDDPFQDVYKSFVLCYQKSHEEILL